MLCSAVSKPSVSSPLYWLAFLLFPPLLVSVLKQLRALSTCKAAGIDEVCHRLRKGCAESLADSLCFLFIEGIFPEPWKAAIVQPIFKQNGERCEAKNYRPVVVYLTKSIISFFFFFFLLLGNTFLASMAQVASRCLQKQLAWMTHMHKGNSTFFLFTSFLLAKTSVAFVVDAAFTKQEKIGAKDLSPDFSRPGFFSPWHFGFDQCIICPQILF